MATLAGVQANLTLQSAGFQQGLTRATQSLNQFAASGARANQQLQQQFTQTAAASRQLRGVTQQLGFQIQDIIVQLQAGQAKAIIFAQQFSQIASIFRGPWAAAIAIGIAALGGLVSMFQRSGAAATDLQGATEKLNTAFSKHNDSIDEVIERYRELTEQQQEFQRVSQTLSIAELEKKLAAAGAAARQTTEDFLTSQEGMTRLFTVFGADVKMVNPFTDLIDPEILAEVVRLKDALDADTIALGEFATGIAQLREEAGENAPEALIALDDSLRGGVTSAIKLEEEVKNLKEQLGALAQVSEGSATTLKEAFSQFEKTMDFIDEGQKAAEKQARADERAGEAAQRLAEQRAESITGLAAEVAGAQKLVVAQGQGVDAIRDVEAAIQAYNKIRQLKLSDDSKEAQQILRLVTALSDEEAARELAKEAAAQASAGSALQAEIRARGKQTEELRVQLKLLAIKDQLGNEAAEALEEEVRATERLRSSLLQVNASRGLEETIDEQRLLLGYAGEETEEYQIQLKLLQLKQSGIENITPEMRRQVELWAQQGTELEKLSAQEDAFGDALENTAESVQGAFTGAYENIFSGGVDTFSDLAEEIKRIFIRLAAEIAALMTIRPLLAPLAGGAAGFGGLFGGAAGAGSLAAGTLVTPGGVPIPSVAPGAPFPVAAGPGLLGPGLLGGLGGALLAPMLFGGGAGTSIGGGLGGAGGAIGGALLGSLFPGVGTVLGAVGGGLLGGLGGGFLGSLFGGGGPSGNEASIGGGFGRAGAGGTGEAAKFVVEFDKQMSALLNDRQLKLADQALRAAKSVSVKYGDEGLSEGDRARLAAGRVAPVAGALGFRKSAFKNLGAEEGLAQLQEAIELEKVIQDLTSAVTPFRRSILDLREEFAAAESRAKELGISTSGMGKALRQAEQELRDQRALERSSLKLQLQAIIGSGSASKELAVAIAGIRLQFQSLRKEAEALGVSLELVKEAEKAAIKQAKEAAQQMQEQRRFERASLKLQLQSMIGTGSASRELALAIALVRLQFQGLKKDAKELGIDPKLVKEAEKAAVQQTKEASRQMQREREFERADLKLQLQAMLGTGNASRQLALEIAGIRLQFDRLTEDAKRLGVSLELVSKAEKAAVQQAKAASREAERNAKRQRAADKDAAKAFIRDFTTSSDYQREVDQINQTYKEAVRLAREYNLSERGLSEARLERMRALRKQKREEIDALALSVIDPFKALSDPLRDFVEDLERSLLSPVELYRVAQEDFRETARRAQAGDVEAIQELAEAGKFYIEQAGAYGAGPEQVSAIQEVMHATEGVTTQVDISMREASKGITDEIRKASNRQDDTLKELVATSKDIVKELKKLRI